MTQPPSSGRLLNRTVARRAFGVLGPTEALFEMTAFVVALWIAGWRIGDTFPTGAPLYAASGAAFMTVVIAQSANAFACRSVRRPAWKLGWFSNWFLVASVLIELAFAIAVVALPAAADLLEHRWPPAGAWIVIAASAPAVLLVDAGWKRAIRGQCSAVAAGGQDRRSEVQGVERS